MKRFRQIAATHIEGLMYALSLGDLIILSTNQSAPVIQWAILVPRVVSLPCHSADREAFGRHLPGSHSRHVTALRTYSHATLRVHSYISQAPQFLTSWYLERCIMQDSHRRVSILVNRCCS